MAHAEKCPICEGRGRLRTFEGDTESLSPCHGCDGKGWVSVQDEIVTVLSPLSIEPVMPPNSTGDDLRWPNTTYTYSG